MDIIERRFGLNGKTACTLEEIGLSYGLTRERVRQIEAKLLAILGELFSTGSYVKHFAKKQLSYELDALDFARISEFKKGIAKNDYFIPLVQALHFWQLSANSHLGELDLLLECFGFVRNPSGLNQRLIELKPGWLAVAQKKTIEHYLDDFNHLFKKQNQFEWQTFLTLLQQRHKSLDYADIQQLLPCFTHLELVHDNVDDCNYIQIVFNKLSTTDKAYRLLKNRESLQVSTLVELINNLSSHKILTVSNLRNQMVSDKRFEPIGRSGEWRLKDPNHKVRNISIFEAMVEVLHERQEPLSFEQIVDGVKTIRGNSFEPKSVQIYLNIRPEFQVLQDGRYVLQQWSNEHYQRKVKRKIIDMGNFNQELENVLPIGQAKRLAEVVGVLREKGFNEQTIRARIIQLEQRGYIVDVTLPNQRNRVIKSVSYDLDADPRMKTKREIIQTLILQELNNLGDTPITKGALYRIINQRYPCIRQTFYRYLAEMDGQQIHTSAEGKKYFVALVG